jgi:glycosyltransferase involved in cell wall biosynthesis
MSNGQQVKEIVTLFVRAQRPGEFSIERVFQWAGSYEHSSFDFRIVVLPHAGTTIRAIIRNIVFAHRNSSAVNHVTGDCHYAVLGLPRATTVLTIHDLVGLQRYRGVKRWLYRLWWFSVPCWWVARITTISNATLAELVSTLPGIASRVSVVYNPLPDGIYQAPRLNLPGLRALQIGTGWNKNLLQAAKGVAVSGGVLRIIGRLSSGQREALDALDLHWENFFDQTPREMMEHLQWCTCLLFLSSYEGFGLPVIEAQASGRPVIASDLPVLREVSNGAALHVSLENPTDLVNKLMSLSDSAKADALVCAGLKNAKRFESSRVADAYVAVYEVVSGRQVDSA